MTVTSCHDWYIYKADSRFTDRPKPEALYNACQSLQNVCCGSTRQHPCRATVQARYQPYGRLVVVSSLFFVHEQTCHQVACWIYKSSGHGMEVRALALVRSRNTAKPMTCLGQAVYVQWWTRMDQNSSKQQYIWYVRATWQVNMLQAVH